MIDSPGVADHGILWNGNSRNLGEPDTRTQKVEFLAIWRRKLGIRVFWQSDDFIVGAQSVNDRRGKAYYQRRIQHKLDSTRRESQIYEKGKGNITQSMNWREETLWKPN